MTPPHRVLVTDGEQRASLAIVRSLGRRSHVVHVAGSSSRTIAGGSRFCRREWITADALSDPPAFVSGIESIIAAANIDVVLPVTEAALLALLPVRDRFRGVSIPFPSLGAFTRISDKALVLQQAERLGIATPRQHVLASSGNVPDIEFPVVVKPSRSVSDAGGARRKHGVRYARDARELQEIVRTEDPSAFPLLLQQRVVGPGVGIFLLLWDGEMVAVFSHRRIREKPPTGGVSVYRESIAPDPELVRRSRALLDAFEWSGVAMVEYKVDAGTGTPYLMEVNGRFWGSLQLAVDAGVDFPALLLEAAVEGSVRPVAGYRTGVRSRWWWGDVDQLIARLRPSSADLALPPDAPSRMRSLLDFLVVWRPGDRNEILRIADPGPFARETLNWVRGR